MKKLRRVLALVGAILLIGMYLATMLLAIFGNADSKGWLMASIVMTVLIPVLLYAIQLVARVFSGKNQKEAFRRPRLSRRLPKIKIIKRASGNKPRWQLDDKSMTNLHASLEGDSSSPSAAVCRGLPFLCDAIGIDAVPGGLADKSAACNFQEGGISLSGVDNQILRPGLLHGCLKIFDCDTLCFSPADIKDQLPPPVRCRFARILDPR